MSMITCRHKGKQSSAGIVGLASASRKSITWSFTPWSTSAKPDIIFIYYITQPAENHTRNVKHPGFWNPWLDRSAQKRAMFTDTYAG